MASIPDEFQFDGRDGKPVPTDEIRVSLERIARAEHEEGRK